MDPLTAFLLSGIVVGVVKKANDSARDITADWRALRNGEELPSHKHRAAVLEAQREAIKTGVADPTKMTATQYARMLNNIGRQPGVMMLARNQYRNMVSAADRRLSSYWDEMERRANDEEYRAQRDREKEQAKQEAQDRREERNRRIREGYEWVKTGATNGTKSGREKLRDWLGDSSPSSKKPPPKPPPEDSPKDPSGESSGKRRWWESGGRPTTDDGGARSGDEGDRESKGEERGAPEDDDPLFGYRERYRRSEDEGEPGYGAGDPGFASRERHKRAEEWAAWYESNQRPGAFTVTEDPDREPAPAPPRPLTRGPGALGPASAPSPGPKADPAPSTGGNPMADKNSNTKGQGGSPASQSGSDGGIAKSSVKEFERQGRSVSAQPIKDNRRPANPEGGTPYKKGTAPSLVRQQGRPGALGQMVSRLNYLVGLTEANSIEIRDIIEGLDQIGAGQGLMEALQQWSNNLSRDATHGLQVTQYLAMADQQIGALAAQYREAPTDLTAYSGARG